MQIVVKTLVGRIIQLEVEPTDNITSVKTKIHGKEKIPPDQQRLMFNGKLLEDQQILDECGIVKDSVLQLAVRSAPPPPPKPDGKLCNIM